MIGIYILFFRCFLSKKRTKGEISDRFSAKTPYNRMTIFTKRNGFLWQVQRVFLTGFWSKKGQNVRFQADFLGKPLIIERQFFQNVTVFMIGTSCILDVFLSKKRTKRENSDGLSGETPYNRMTIFTKSNGFLLQVHRVF